jgi:hypothetical protein
MCLCALTTWTQQAYLKADNTGTEDGFELSVAASGDTVVVGAGGEDSSSIGKQFWGHLLRRGNALFTVTGDTLDFPIAADFETKNSSTVRLRATDATLVGLLLSEGGVAFRNDSISYESVVATTTDPPGPPPTEARIPWPIRTVTASTP